MSAPLFVDVILPLAIANAYTYSVPAELSQTIKFGQRVIVQFGKTKIYTALVYRLHSDKPELFEPKEIISILDENPVVLEPQVKLWEWISSYYQCTLGEVFKAALPSGLKLESETNIVYVEDFVADRQLKQREQQVADLLSAKKKMTLSELSKELKVKNVMPAVKSLLEMGAIAVSEEVRQKFKPKTEPCVRLVERCLTEAGLHAVFDELKNANKQLELLMFYLNESRFLSENVPVEITKQELLKKSGCSSVIFSSLVNRQIFEVYDKEVSRLAKFERSSVQEIVLSEAQQNALGEVEIFFETKNIVLLHGVTSSGKTEIYIQLIKKVISEGKQVLFLLPEIALTTQITSRLRKVFGNSLGVYHSKFSDNERVEVWKNMLKDDGFKIILGVRSSVFLPFKNLGLVVIDEEHENTYKQYDPAPRYHARNSAIMLAHSAGAKVLLGSATPSVESYHLATTGKYGYVKLFTRYKNINLPEISVVDIKEAKRKKEMFGRFSLELVQQMREAFSNKEQVILFQNRRGFSHYVECRSCSFVPRCKNCDVSLTYHKFSNQLTCHYCGYSYSQPETCPVCGNPTLETVGFGTEKVEEEVNEIFPEVRVGRLDLDVAKTKNGAENVIKEFEDAKIDVLVGTQMISKGLDFERVRVVGILNADSLLNYPDFRAGERAFQLMAQVSGRAGRKHTQGRVIIQTTNPAHPIISQVKANDYHAMYSMEVAERMEFSYPPFFRLIYIYVKGADQRVVDSASEYLANVMRASFAERVYGPNKPVVMRIQNLYIKKIMIKFEHNISADKVKKLIRDYVDHTLSIDRYKSVMIYLDVDPM